MSTNLILVVLPDGPHDDNAAELAQFARAMAGDGGVLPCPGYRAPEGVST